MHPNDFECLHIQSIPLFLEKRQQYNWDQPTLRYLVYLCAIERVSDDFLRCVLDFTEYNGADGNCHDALVYASLIGDLENVKLLCEWGNPKVDQGSPLVRAVEEGHTDIVKYLIPLSDPKIGNSRALATASIYGKQEMFDLLVPHSDVFAAFHSMSNDPMCSEQEKEIITAHIAKSERDHINQHVISNKSENASVKRKI